jgi:ADP-ribose pyrophosphatase YjhB (NUDIX family)
MGAKATNSNPGGKFFQTSRLALIYSGNGVPEILLVLDQDMRKPQWKVPGGVVKCDEHPQKTARREFKEETGEDVPSVEKFYAVDKKAREPDQWKRMYLLHKTNKDRRPVKVREDFQTYEIRAARWFPVDSLPLDGDEEGSMGFKMGVSNARHLSSLVSRFMNVMERGSPGCTEAFAKFLCYVDTHYYYTKY